jgi:DNA-binding LacI/PurR family transcriptional regulator
VTVGCKVLDPCFHFATNDQYSTGMLAHDRLLDYGYKRVGFAIPHYVECIVEQRFSSGFRNALERRGRASSRASIFRYKREEGAKPFLEWFHTFKPDAICTIFPEVGVWLKKENICVPEDVAIATLDWNEDLRDWSGVDQESRRVGAAAIDVVVQMLQRNELGPPAHPFGLNIEGTWVDGKTAPRKTPLKG